MSIADGAQVAAIVVTYNSSERIRPLLDSLDASTADVSVIVVDNGSADDTAAIVREYRGVTLIETHANLGYSGGINVGRQHVRPDQAVAILNPDLVVAPDALERMHLALVPGVGIVGPQIRNTDGTRFPSLFREPGLLNGIGEAVLGDRMPARPASLQMIVRGDSSYLHAGDAEWVSGAALMISPRCNAEVGEWDADTFFLYWEETDFQRRAREAGFRIRYEPSAVVTHEIGGSGSSDGLEALMAVNRVRYAEKYHGRAWSRTMRWIAAAQYGARAGRRPELRLAAALLRDPGRWDELPQADRIPWPEAAAGKAT